MPSDGLTKAIADRRALLSEIIRKMARIPGLAYGSDTAALFDAADELDRLYGLEDAMTKDWIERNAFGQ